MIKSDIRCVYINISVGVKAPYLSLPGRGHHPHGLCAEVGAGGLESLEAAYHHGKHEESNLTNP